MSNLVMWNLIVGFLVPNLIAVIQQPKWSSRVRATLTAVVSIIAGGGTAYFNDQFNTGDIVGSILVIGVAAITFYNGFWKPTGVAPAIEHATSPSGSDSNQRGLYNERGESNVLYIVLVVVVVLVLIALFSRVL